MAKEDCHRRVQKHPRQGELTPGPRSIVQHPIGVFDSGVGGLSVLRALREALPHEQFVYVADSGHAPYGERDDHYVLKRSHAITDYLRQQHHIKAMVVACNTATAAAIGALRGTYADLPIVGIEPALKPAAQSSKTGLVGVMATRGTLSSEKFAGLLHGLHGQATFVLQPCDGLADAIERFDTPLIESLCQRYLHEMGKFGTTEGTMDTLVLGCTHYPFVSGVLQKLTGTEVTQLEPGAPVARRTKRVLEDAGLLQTASNATGIGPVPPQYFSTGNTLLLDAALQRWMHESGHSKALDV